MPAGKDPQPGNAGGCLVGREKLSSQLSSDSCSLVSGPSISFPLDLHRNTGLILSDRPWWIAASLLPRYGKFCLEELYINVSFNVDLSFIELCKMQRTRRSVGHTAVCWATFYPSKGKYMCTSTTRIIWILYFPHLCVLPFILQYLLEDTSTELKSECLSILQQKSASHRFNPFLWYIPIHDHISMQPELWGFFG